ncbi:hypothetical protein LZ318_04490 [Saccharopolyspora indica]|uniref:hypothetical protein n=1 Tax=Saccharopolyspora indica TaxID=1229659 RepID=UPI0022EB9DCF|nr:hypothetical protein [Saccharopolyspora indica]MDA3646475.1 hypothetical protein [Saccharopolyspora indica]
MNATSASGPPDSGSPDPRELLNDLCNEMVDLAPEEGWLRIDLMSKMTVPVQDLSFTVIMEDGSSPEVTPTDEFNVILAKLRTAMYQPDPGAWFSARVMISPPAKVNYHFNYEFEPEWDPPIEAGCYVEDLEMFPRDPLAMPVWLKDRVHEAGKEKH